MEKISPESVMVKLENKDLWDKFNTFGTEMVITKTGRRMFPFLEVSIKGLQPDETYMVILDITKVDDRRYKYNEKENHWKYHSPHILSPTPVGMFVHPLCPCSGRGICVQPMSFNKVKLTNNPHTVSFGHILLDSMCRYKPRLSIVTYHDYHNQRWENGVAFMFKETEFIAVTAYMNKEITKLKINNNPFARAFRETGLKGKGLLSNSTSSGANGIDLEEQTDGRSNETQAPMAITYWSNEESNDGIQVLHVSPASIIVTDVLPSLPSSLPATPNLPSSPNMSTTSEVNVVFASFGNAATATGERVIQTSSYGAEKIGLDPLLYPGTGSQSITVEKNGFIEEKFGGKASSSRGGFIEAYTDGDILCKVIDVRSIRETPPSDEQGNKTRMSSSLKCQENMECLAKESQRKDSSDKCQRIMAETTTKCLKYEGNCSAEGCELANEETERCDNYESFGGANENHIDGMHNGDCRNDDLNFSDNPSEMTRKTMELEDICKDTNVSTTMEKAVNNSVCDKGITRENECNNLANSEKAQERQSNKETIANNRVEGNTSGGDVDSDCRKESTSDEEFPTEEDPKPQISKLLNFVNSVPMPGVLNLGTKKTLVTHQDRNKNSLPKKSSEILPLLGQKRPVAGGRPAVERKKSKSLDQADNRFRSVSHSNVTSKTMGQSKDSLETLSQSAKSLRSSDMTSVDQPEGMAKSVSRSQEADECTNPPNKLKSSISDSTPALEVKIKKESLNENSRFVKEQGTKNEALREKTATEEKTSKGIPTTVIDVGHKEYLVPNRLHPRNFLYHAKYLERAQGKERSSGGLQGLSQVNSTRNEDPSFLEKDNGMRQVVGDQNGVFVESASTKSFPVILSSYSIDPSKFPNQQRNIDLNNETRVALSYENRIPVVYPAENFLIEENQDSEVFEKCSKNETETNCQPTLGEEREACANGESNLNYRKIFPKPTPFQGNYTLNSAQKFIDLNSNMNDNLYQRQTDNNYVVNKGVPLQVLYTFETRMSLNRAPDPRLPEVYSPTRTTFTGYASNLICSTPPISTANKGFQPVPGKYY